MDENIKSIYQDLEKIKIEVAVMQEKLQNNYTVLIDKIDDLSNIYKLHCDETRRNQQINRRRRWGIWQSILVGAVMLVITYVWQTIIK